MTNHIIQKALTLWNIKGAEVTLAAHRENTVFKVQHREDFYALRLHRVGYRSQAELSSELDWMAYLNSQSINTPRPIHSQSNRYCEKIENIAVDVLTWLEGDTLGNIFLNTKHDVITAAYFKLGQSLAQLHITSDNWTKPADFTRPSWDKDGLLGDTPLWNRFWENPKLSPKQQNTLRLAQNKASAILDKIADDLDYGLIHADAIPDNILVQNGHINLIDFDDSGFGYRLFELATTINKIPNSPHADGWQSAFLEGYQTKRKLKLEHLPLFRALRAFSYIGWIMSRLDHRDADIRLERFMNSATHHISELDEIIA